MTAPSYTFQECHFAVLLATPTTKQPWILAVKNLPLFEFSFFPPNKTGLSLIGPLYLSLLLL